MPEKIPVTHPKLTPAEEHWLGLHEIPDRHREEIRARIERNLASYANEEPATRRALLVASVSLTVNNFFDRMPGGGARNLTQLEEINAELARNKRELHAKIDDAAAAIGFDAARWAERFPKRPGYGFGIRKGKPAVKTAMTFKLWPLFKECLKHVDDSHELTG